MNEVKIGELILKHNVAEEFENIENHMEQCSGQEVTNENVAKLLIYTGMKNYKFL